MKDETQFIRTLDDAIAQSRARATIDRIIREVSRSLSDSGGQLAWQPIPLASYGPLPKGIASSWIFVLRAGISTGAERHPNSIQRVCSLSGSADMQTWDGTWVSHHLRSEPDAPIESRWLSIPVNVWHRPVIGSRDWVVVSFHTASADDLIEELPSDDEHPDAGPTRSEVYAGRSSR
jgi:hypothetical protein